MPDGGGSKHAPLSHGAREVLRRLRRIDQSEGVWRSLVKIGEPQFEDEKRISPTQVRYYLRELQRKERIYALGYSDRGTIVYLLPDSDKAPYDATKIARGRFDPARSVHLPWDAEPARALVRPGGAPLERPTPRLYRGVPLGARLRRDYAEEIIKAAIDSCIETYGERLEGVRTSKKGAIFAACKRIKEERREAEATRQAAQLAELRRLEQSQRAALQEELTHDPERDRNIEAAVAQGVPPQIALLRYGLGHRYLPPDASTAPALPAASSPATTAASGVHPRALPPASVDCPEMRSFSDSPRTPEEAPRGPGDCPKTRRFSDSPAVAPAGSTPAGARTSALTRYKPPARALVPLGAELTIGDVVRALVKLKRITTKPATQKFYADRVPIIERLVGHVPAAVWDHAAVIDYVERRKAEGVQLNTTGKELENLIKPALKLAIRGGAKLPDPDTYWPELPYSRKARKRYLKREHLVPLFMSLKKPHHRDWLLWGVYTGACKAELETLAWEDVNLPAREVHIRGTKAEKRDRLMGLHPRLVKWCEKRVAKGPRAGPLLRRWSSSCRDLERACERAGIPKVSLHDLRRTFASWLRQAGVSDAHLAELLGHADTRQVVKVYGQLSKQQLHDAIKHL